MSDAKYVKVPQVAADDDNHRPEKYRWKGSGPEPAKWRAEDGTLVYRSYEDYCDD